ncbi:MAG TPA: TIGR03557 family F420-dependent LLM class oxidoreductase [Solirubrobacteraceae bacterium]|nr:TIGR03557 family F420-dependent LLM class oxidoreductase [Solirubrobacteraceae bacterium]
MKIGYFLSSEETAPAELVHHAALAEQAGFQGLWISDHFHPWNDAQGHSAFVWSVIGAIAQATSRMKVTTAVTCPTVRLHPAIVAQAAATSAVLLEGRFALGVGSGEALNEHILGARWPEADERLEMLEEAVEVIRTLWQGGVQSHRGRHYRVENARIYDLPEQAPPILISGFGPKATELAARAGDGFCTVAPVKEAVETVREKGGQDKLVAGALKVCWDEDERRARETAYRLWPTDALPGELSQILPTPAHFEQASQLVTEDQVAESIPCGPDLDAHLEKIGEFEEAGFDELYVQQIGDGHEQFFELYAQEILPRFEPAGSRPGAPVA